MSPVRRDGTVAVEDVRALLKDTRLDGPLDRAAATFLRERDAAGTAGGSASRIVSAFLDGVEAELGVSERTEHIRSTPVSADHGAPNTGDEQAREMTRALQMIASWSPAENAMWARDTAREALDRARSPQGEDHEAGIRAMFRAYEDWQDGKVEDPFAHMADAYRAAYLSRVSPARDGTVAVDESALAEFQEGLTRALNRHGVPAMPSWDAAIDWLAEHGSRSPQGENREPTTEELERDCERIAEARQAMHPRYGAQGDT